MTNLLHPPPADPRFALPPAGFNWSQQDADAALAVLADVTDSPREVVILTDEEVVALDGLQNEQLAPTPWLDAQELTREQLGGIALRGLIARRLVALGPTLTPDGTPTGDYELTAEQSITGALMLRRTAQTLVRMERSSNAGDRWLFAYVHRDRGVLIEDVDPNGLHVFGATTIPGAVEYLRAIANFSDAAGAASEPIGYTSAEFEALTAVPEPCEGAEGVSRIAVVNHGSDDVQAAVVYAGPTKVGLLVPDAAAERVVVSGITDDVLVARLTAALSGERAFG